MKRSSLPLATSLFALIIGSNALIMGSNSILMHSFSSSASKSAPTQKTYPRSETVSKYLAMMTEGSLVMPQHRAYIEQGRLRCMIEDFKAAGNRPACDQKDILEFASSMPRAKTNEAYRNILEQNKLLRKKARELGLNPYARAKAP